MEEVDKQQIKKEDTKPAEQEVGPNLDDFGALFDLVAKHKANPRNIIPAIKEHIKNKIKKVVDESSGFLEKYNILFIYDEHGSISDFTKNQFYSALQKLDKNKELLVILYNYGGQIEPAFFISKYCKEYSKRFIVTIPRQAKSAATLISLGADEIHMGNASELGPIDPQVESEEVGRLVSVLTLEEALKSLAELTTNFPKSSEMFARFLVEKLDLKTLGHFKRLPLSAKDYARRLLEPKRNELPEAPEIIAQKLVYEYKEHSFIIDKDEAQLLLGQNMVKSFSKEYFLAEGISKFLESLSLVIRVLLSNYRFSIIGNIEDGFMLLPKR